MHTLTAITIRRSCESVALDLAPYTPFVGYNNAGKSNILSAIRWLVAPFALTPADYLQADRPIQVDGTITGITPALLDRLDARHRSKVQPFAATLGDTHLLFIIRTPITPPERGQASLRAPTVPDCTTTPDAIRRHSPPQGRDPVQL